jgi:hypothetical protein
VNTGLGVTTLRASPLLCALDQGALGPYHQLHHALGHAHGWWTVPAGWAGPGQLQIAPCLVECSLDRGEVLFLWISLLAISMFSLLSVMRKIPCPRVLMYVFILPLRALIFYPWPPKISATCYELFPGTHSVAFMLFFQLPITLICSANTVQGTKPANRSGSNAGRAPGTGRGSSQVPAATVRLEPQPLPYRAPRPGDPAIWDHCLDLSAIYSGVALQSQPPVAALSSFPVPAPPAQARIACPTPGSKAALSLLSGGGLMGPSRTLGMVDGLRSPSATASGRPRPLP